jgi:Putative capsular polysaccharide synthesis protein
LKEMLHTIPWFYSLMPLPFSVFLLTALLIAVATGLVLYHALSRRVRKLQDQIQRDVSQTQRDESKQSSQMAKEIEQAARATEALKKEILEHLATVHQEAAAIARELPVFRQVLYALGQSEIHAVVSFPKTGGSTLIATLANLFPDKALPTATFHTHLLAPPGQSVAAFFEGILAFTPDTPWTEHDDFFPVAWDRKLGIGHAHRCLLDERKCLPLDSTARKEGMPRRSGSKPVINYILCAREPVAACVSMLFQFVSTWKRWENLSDDALLGYLRSASSPPLVPSPPGCPWPLMQQAWWGEQIERTFGVDLLSIDFDRERGWHVYDFGQVRFLVIRLEDFKKLPEALGGFYELPPQCVRVIDENIGELKGPHGERYRNFRARAKVPADILDLAYSSRLARHFYTDAELESFRARWSEPPGA